MMVLDSGDDGSGTNDGGVGCGKGPNGDYPGSGNYMEPVGESCTWKPSELDDAPAAPRNGVTKGGGELGGNGGQCWFSSVGLDMMSTQ